MDPDRISRIARRVKLRAEGYIRCISLKTPSTVEDNTGQYGARDKLTRKMNISSRFVSSPCRGSCAGFSRTLLRIVPTIAPYLTPRISDIERVGEKRQRGGRRGKPRCSAWRNLLPDANVREMQSTRFDYPDPGRSSSSRFLGASRSPTPPVNAEPGTSRRGSEIKRISPPVARRITP